MSALDYRTARAQFPHRPEMWEVEYLYEPLPLPVEHPELDLFGRQRVVEEDAGVGTGLTPEARREEIEKVAEPLRARMLNEFVYCPRLFYYEHVEGVFLKNADTERGAAIHEKVDRGRGSLPRARKKAKPKSDEAAGEPGEVSATEQAEAMAGGEEAAVLDSTPPNQESGTEAPEVETIHSRSAMMSSERLGVVAKMDVIEVEMTTLVRNAETWTPMAGTRCAASDSSTAAPGEERGHSCPPVDGPGMPSPGDAGADGVASAGREEAATGAVSNLTKKVARRSRKGDEGPDLFAMAAAVAPEAETREAPATVTAAQLMKAPEAPRLLQVQLKEHVVQRVTPVDYKAGSPRIGEERNELWDADKMQLGLQILVLRDNGYACDEGVIYYRGTKQRVTLVMTAEIEAWIIDQIAQARRVATSEVIPPPLVHSPKCVRCSLAPVCLPDETRLLKRGMAVNRGGNATEPEDATEAAAPAGRFALPGVKPRRLIAARDDERALYLNTQGHRVGIKSERLIVKDGESEMDSIRLNDVTHVSLFGNIQLTTQAIQELCEQEIPVAYFSQSGWFYGITRGHGLTNVHTRIRQFATAANPLQCLAVAQKMVQAKIRNHRTMLMRLHVQPPAAAVQGMKDIARRTADARGLDELLGHEGAAAGLYFQHFAGMIKVGDEDLDDEIPGLDVPKATTAKRLEEKEVFTFDFTQRNRRPPKDPVNAMLSLAYSLLAKDCTIAALAVGFDPYVGFYHQPRQGRPALALDLMEEFRPLIAESAVLTAINNRMVTPGHFVRAGESVNLTKHGRKAFFHAYEQRMNALITHPVFDYKVSYRRVLELQARLLARWLTGEIPEYVPMITR